MQKLLKIIQAGSKIYQNGGLDRAKAHFWYLRPGRSAPGGSWVDPGGDFWMPVGAKWQQLSPHGLQKRRQNHPKIDARINAKIDAEKMKK